jgi:hypothetical protein
VHGDPFTVEPVDIRRVVMPTFAPASDQAEFTPPEPGRYIATCTDIKDAPPKAFGAGVQWSFTLTDPQTGVTLQNADGEDLDFWQFTSTKMSPKSRARPLVEALLGRTLDVANREVPDVRLLIGRSMLTILIHEPGEDGTPRARLTSCTPYTPPSTPAVAAPPHRPAPPPATADALKAAVKAAIRKAEILDTKKHLDWLTYQPDQLSQADLQQLLADINDDVLAS